MLWGHRERSESRFWSGSPLKIPSDAVADTALNRNVKMHLAENIHYLFSRYFCFLDHCLFRESSSYSCFLTKSSQGVESHLFTARSCCYQGSRVSEVCKPHDLVENVYPSRGFHFPGGKRNPVSPPHWGHLDLASITKPKFQGCRMWSRKHSQARIELQEEKKKPNWAYSARP